MRQQRSRGRRFLPYLLVIVLGLGGCGVSATDRSVDEGDPAVGGPVPPTTRFPHEPDDADSADQLVRYFLQASAGGSADANQRVKAYLTDGALEEWWKDPFDVDNPPVSVPLSVVRIVNGPTQGAAVGVDRRIQVTVDYQTVGTLIDLGRVDEVATPQTRSLTFWVVQLPAEDSVLFRIDEIVGWQPGGLLLSDEGLKEYYRTQPIYFWDTLQTSLVPDVRYVPLTLTVDKQADSLLTWLTAGPSPWFGGSVQRLPTGTRAEPVSRNEQTLEVRLSFEPAATEDTEALRRLSFQLQWSLSEPRIDLYIDNQLVADLGGDYRASNHSSSYGDPQGYDIGDDGVVVALGVEPGPELLNTPANTGVVYAAITGDATVGAFVQEDQFGRRSLQIVRSGQTPVGALLGDAPLGRPSFVPDTELVLVPTGGADGRLMAVSTADGRATDAGRGLTGVTVAAVSPDGRRIALVTADGEVYVSILDISTGTVTVGSAQRQLLAGQLTARAVTWLSESWLVVSGTSGDAPAMWRVTADGVVADNLSGNMLGLAVDDLVCYPTWNSLGDVFVFAHTPVGVYSFRSESVFGQELGLTRPFFGD